MPRSTHVTLAANTPTPVTLDQDYNVVEVVNMDGAAAVYFTIDGSTPAVAGDNTVGLPAVIGGVEIYPETRPVTVINLISVGTPRVAVRGIQ